MIDAESAADDGRAVVVGERAADDGGAVVARDGAADDGRAVVDAEGAAGVVPFIVFSVTPVVVMGNSLLMLPNDVRALIA